MAKPARPNIMRLIILSRFTFPCVPHPLQRPILPLNRLRGLVASAHPVRDVPPDKVSCAVGGQEDFEQLNMVPPLRVVDAAKLLKAQMNRVLAMDMHLLWHDQLSSFHLKRRKIYRKKKIQKKGKTYPALRPLYMHSKNPIFPEKCQCRIWKM